MATTAVHPEPALPGAGGERLGEALVDRGLLSQEDLEWALGEHERTGERLGDALLSAGLVRRNVLHQVLAELWGCAYVDLRAEPPNPNVLRGLDPAMLLREHWIPVAQRAGHTIVATSERPTAARAERIRTVLGVDDVTLVATSDWDVQGAVADAFAQRLVHQAAFGLAERDPERSAITGLSRGQRVAAAVLGVGLVASLLLAPMETLLALLIAVNAILVGSVAFKFTVSVIGWRVVRREEGEGPREDERMADEDLPVYTVLVPLYGEGEIVPYLVDHLESLDYPAAKLQILLLMEESDHETIAAAREALRPGNIRVVVVPDGRPRTKPRACNLGLLFARGEFLVIYDAEDRPEPGQLRESVAEFRRSPEEVVCLQARLNYFNRNENLLTRMFTLEYSFWFDEMLPGLERMGLPIPLGGTSNHFRVSALRELGGWDAFNVTEDADLGLRASQMGKRVGVISSTTYEEACMRVGPWIRQRTRWIKGYMQTAVVHARRPLESMRTLRPRGVAGFLLLIAGTPLTFLLAPILWIVFLVWLAGVAGAPVGPPLPAIFGWLGLAGLVAGNGLMVMLNGLAVLRRRLWDLAPFAVLAPFYWVLHSYAAWRAVWKLLTNPHDWEKTPHGLTSEAGELRARVRRVLGDMPVAARQSAATAHPVDSPGEGLVERRPPSALVVVALAGAAVGWTLMAGDLVRVGRRGPDVE